MPDKTVTATKFRSHLSTYLNKVRFARERVPIYRHGEMIAVLMPLWDYDRIVELDGKSEEYKRAQMNARWERWQHVKRMARKENQR